MKVIPAILDALFVRVLVSEAPRVPAAPKTNASVETGVALQSPVAQSVELFPIQVRVSACAVPDDPAIEAATIAKMP